MNEKIIKAINFARDKHTGQLRDGGEDYIVHPQQTAKIISAVSPENIDLICAAWLHDTIEDTQTSFQDLQDEFGPNVAKLVLEVTATRQNGLKSFPRLKSREGIMLKLADRLSNISDMDGWTDEQIDIYLQKTKFW